MLKASGRADAAAKGQRYGDPWQMAADIVIGSRVLGSREKDSAVRWVGIHVFNFMINLLAGTRITDCSSGFRAFRVEFLKNIMLLQSLRARDVMTPRTVVVSLDETLSVRQAFEDHERLRFSRIPVYHTDREAIQGYVLKNEAMDDLRATRAQARRTSETKGSAYMNSGGEGPAPVSFAPLSTFQDGLIAG